MKDHKPNPNEVPTGGDSVTAFFLLPGIYYVSIGGPLNRHATGSGGTSMFFVWHHWGWCFEPIWSVRESHWQHSFTHGSGKYHLSARPKICTYSSSESVFFVWHYRADTPTMANYDQLVRCFRSLAKRMARGLVDRKFRADPLSWSLWKDWHQPHKSCQGLAALAPSVWAWS